MKRIQLSLLALVMFQFSCVSTEDASLHTLPEIDYTKVSEELTEMFRGAFSMTESLEIASVIDRTEKQLTVRIEMENISEATRDHFKNYFDGSQGFNKRAYYPAPPFSSRFNEENAFQTFENVIDTAGVFTDIQKEYIKSLARDIADLDTYSEGFELVSDFRNQVVHSRDLSHGDKVLLLEIAAGSQVLLEFIGNNNFKQMRNNLSDLKESGLSVGRELGCSVDWRKVWIGGVVGLTAGAVSGAIAGATIGTVTVPILGTATGAVGGAVFAGASGFVSGIVYGVATDLIASCFRPGDSELQQVYASCELAWEAYINYKTNRIPTDCFRIALPIKEL